MNYKDVHHFIENYQAFLNIQKLMYSPGTSEWVEATELFGKLVFGLLKYTERVTQEDIEQIASEFPQYGGMAMIQSKLVGQSHLLPLQQKEERGDFE